MCIKQVFVSSEYLSNVVFPRSSIFSLLSFLCPCSGCSSQRKGDPPMVSVSFMNQLDGLGQWQSALLKLIEEESKDK